MADELRNRPRRWLVTGGAGFIGSHVVDKLVELGQDIVILDDYSTGKAVNIAHLTGGESRTQAKSIEIIEGDIRDPSVCRRSCRGVEIVLHQAALGSVPRSIADPATTNAVNVDGFVNMMVAARDEGVARFVYASSSAVYGDDPRLPKLEGDEGMPLSPYAASKRANELYAAAFQASYGMKIVGLRYFNVFGPRQDPDGPYAAVIPRWIKAMLDGAACTVFGDGETSRDFCYVANTVQANLLAALCPDDVTGTSYNVSYGGRVTLNELFEELRTRVESLRPGLVIPDKVHEPARSGDVRHSQADLTRVVASLGYSPTHDVRRGLDDAMAWYAANLG